MADKWTIGSNNEGLYNRVKPPEERGTREKKKEQEGRVTVAFGRTQPEENHFIQEPIPRILLEATNSSKTCSSDLRSPLVYVFYSPRPNS